MKSILSLIFVSLALTGLLFIPLHVSANENPTTVKRLQSLNKPQTDKARAASAAANKSRISDKNLLIILVADTALVMFFLTFALVFLYNKTKEQ